MSDPELRSREEYLERELALIAPCASKAAHSRGRVVPEDEHPLRSPYERDRDRIIHSTAFRKLEYKTQVFVNHEGDYYRTRLTHTLEATQIARSAARILRANEDLTEAIALVHDVGHPPFGHAGEAALRECMAPFGGFEHNLHSLRVVDELECHYPGFAGLNLTWEVREGIIKHSKAFDPAAPSPGLAEFAAAPWPSLEAQLVDACDEIAYNAHDVDDGLAAGMITLEELSRVALWRRVLDGRHDLNEAQRRYGGIRALINAQVLDLVTSTAGRITAGEIRSADMVRFAPSLVAAPSDEMAQLGAELRRFLFERVYRHYRVHRMWIKAKTVVAELFEALVSEPGQLPPLASSPHSAAQLTGHASANVPTASRIEPTRPVIARTVCDYLAGLSDREALNEHARLFNPSVSP